MRGLGLGLGLSPVFGGGRGGASTPAAFVLSGGDWYADTGEAATADGYAVSDGSDGYVIDDEAGSGLPVLVRGSRVYLEI